MATATAITPSTLCEKYHLTIEQLSAGTHVVLNGTQHCVIVESASVPGQEYKIIWNSEYKVLQCTAHNGEACKASANGKQCYHKRVALAVIELEKAQSIRERQQEQAEVESTKEYQFEQAIQEFWQASQTFEQLTAEFNQIIQEANEREKSRRDAQRLKLPLNGNKGFSLLR